MIIRSPFGFSQTSCPCPVLPIRIQPHWDARHTMAGKKASTGPCGFGFTRLLVVERFRRIDML
jgi:hypothetical protein